MSRALIAAAVVALAVTASAANGAGDARALTDAARPTQSMSPDDRAFSRMGVQSDLALNDRAHSTSPDDRAFSRMGVQSDLALNDRAHSTSPDDRAFSRAVVSIQPNLNPNPVQVVVHDNGGYRWLHAGEGAAVGFAFALLLAGMALLIVRSRRAVPAV